MESGRWAEMTSDEIFEILSGQTAINVDNAWNCIDQALKKAKDEENDVATARIISEELLLTALGGSEETGVITAQIIISDEQINV